MTREERIEALAHRIVGLSPSWAEYELEVFAREVEREALERAAQEARIVSFGACPRDIDQESARLIGECLNYSHDKAKRRIRSLMPKEPGKGGEGE